MHVNYWFILLFNFINGKSQEDLNIYVVINYIKKEFKEIKESRGNTHKYLGMKFNYDKDEVDITMLDYIEDVI
jgi:hypothetical protein